MKKAFIIILLVLLLFSGCKKEIDFEKPVTFYYLKPDYAFGSPDSLFSKVQVESAGISSQPLLDLYFNGSTDESAISPFPAGTKVIRIEKKQDTLILVMSRNYGSLSDLKLTLANACLYLTCSELTDTSYIQILIDGISTEEDPGILLTPESIIFFDQLAALSAN